jgi:hypothetical protein
LVVTAPTYETRAVLGDAYPRKWSRDYLTHTVKIAWDVAGGTTETPLCRRVKAEHIADRHADDPNLPPRCSTCLKRDPRFK